MKWMMQSGLGLSWEWCIPHLTNATTKYAFGIVGDRKKSKNPGVTDLIGRISKTVYQVKHVEVMGTLFADLCEMLGRGTSRQLLDFRQHRFMGLTRVIRRILEKWCELEHWYGARETEASRNGSEPPAKFPLARDKEDLIQLLSLLQPITVLNRKSQSESANQVEVLLSLYRLRMTTLTLNKPLKDYRSSTENPAYIAVADLTALATQSRELLRDRFDKNYFSRYTDRTRSKASSFCFEMQLLLHPTFKDPNGALSKIVRICSEQQGLASAGVEKNVEAVKEAVLTRLHKVMLSMKPTNSTTEQEDDAAAAAPSPPVFSAELMDMFAAEPDPTPIAPQVIQETRADEELDRWFDEPASLYTTMNNQREPVQESVLDFWRRQCDEKNFSLLPKVARVVFAVPTSSAQIERDFGVSGMMVTAQRTSISGHKDDEVEEWDDTFADCFSDMNEVFEE